MDEMDVLKRVIGWAKQFGFKINGKEVIFNQGNIDAAIDDLDKQFRSWNSKEKDKGNKI